MPTEIVMPRLSDTMEKGTVARWNKRAGDKVVRGEILLEIETDKANMDLESYADGILAKIMVNEGETAQVGSPIGIVAENESELREIQNGGEDSSDSGRQSHPVDQPSTDRRAEPEAAHGPKTENAIESDGRVKASPLARRIAQQRGVDLSQVTGSGPGGRIVREDVEEFEGGKSGDGGVPRPVSEKPKSSEGADRRPQATAAVSGIERPESQRSDEEVALSRMQLAVGRRLAESAATAPHFFVTAEIDMTHAVRMRRQINEAEPDLKITFNDLIVKAVAGALRQFPDVNGSFHDGKVIRHGSVNVGIAVDLPEGLIVPVVRDADRKGLRQISVETKELVGLARDGKLKQEQLEGGTYTVSNLGMFDVDQFTAIINPPQTAILAIGAIQEKPVVIDGEIAIRSRMRVTMSSDHRVVYGAAAASFLSEVRRLLEHPVIALI